MKREAMLRYLLNAAEQAPADGKTQAAIKSARKSLLGKNPTSADYQMILANAGRALDAIADGFAWAKQMREKGFPVEKIAPVVLEQNRKAAALLRM